MTVFATDRWSTNGHLIEAVAKLGYIGEYVLDATYGEGVFWRAWQPERLVKNDLHKNIGWEGHFHFDFRDLPWNTKEFDTVVFDPPYKLSGTPALGQFDKQYGIERPMTLAERKALIMFGAAECARVTKDTLLVKVQDQVCSGKVQWQTDWVRNALFDYAIQLVDRFDFIYTPRPQPGGSVQKHASRNTSQLLVFAR